MIDVRGARLNVVELGQGEPAIVFLHYWGGTSRTYIPLAQELSAGFQCIAFDQRGWGLSSREGEFSLEGSAADTRELVGKLGLKRYILVGHSRGGKVAQLVAAQRPEGLVGLVLLAPAPATPLPVTPDQRQLMLENYQKREGAEFALSILSKQVLSEVFQQQVIEDTLGGALAAKKSWVHRETISDISDEAKKIDVPTIVVVGDEDVVETAPRLREEIPKAIPHATFAILPGLGHLAILEAPDAVSEVIRRFVAGLPSARTGQS